MNLLTAENISKSYGNKTLFDKISIGINDGDKVGIVGLNGSGKSTLLKVLAGFDIPDDGKITKSNEASIGYLPQNSDFTTSNLTVLEQVFNGHSPVMNLLREYEYTLKRIRENPSDMELQNKFFDLNSKMDASNAWEIESQAKTILTKLKINDFDAKISTLSGGQKKRTALASALITPSNILMLDEPTNHLDDETIEWLEEFLNNRTDSLIMVTHDRFFLDKITNKILELDKGNIYNYIGNYSTYLEKKSERLEKQNASEKKRQNLIRKELAWIRRGAKARSTKQKARIERFETLQDKKILNDNSDLEITIQSTRLGKKVINIDNISKGFGDKILIKNFSYNILNDDRIGIIGPNGTGKSTFMNILNGDIAPDHGILDIGETVKIGYYSQQIPDMDVNQRVIQYIQDSGRYAVSKDGQKINVSLMLEKFLFDPSVQWTQLSKLSGGERRRLYLLKVLMKYPNVLLLDEPTNDLDIETLTVLEDYIEGFNGAVITVSHDRYFLDKTVDKIFSFEGNGKITEYTGNYSYFHQIEAEKKQDTAPTKKVTKKIYNRVNTEKPLKFTYNEQLEFNEIESIIEDLEYKLDEKKKEMQEASSNYELLSKLLEEKNNLETELDKKIDRWTYLTELNEKIKAAKKNR
ncbi:ABC transporter ATP-binding protein [Clostridium fermenticellae]|uniref:ABC transporter ATP-binding protein n=1 Tax=Clostridium fermenticellae TaxID=2068654 RepID=A0A386H4E1_9CLOT|nr:ABC-F family ATP-binding cassette domain-containing protein [Clostridium fermenticellae]AYD40403.1 ABC transporter ATP-binding protein [Clostridium fermenticellae]